MMISAPFYAGADSPAAALGLAAFQRPDFLDAGGKLALEGVGWNRN